MIKVVRSDWVSEYYGKHGLAGQFKGLFAKFLKDCNIFDQYIITRSPKQNGIVERHNCTHKDMVRTMMSMYNLPISLWDKALRGST